MPPYGAWIAVDKADEMARRIMPLPGSEWPLSEHGYAIALGHAAAIIRCEVLFTTLELDTLRQWFNCIEDVNPKFLEQPDRALGAKISAMLNARREVNAVSTSVNPSS